jgi:hypothetical protein
LKNFTLFLVLTILLSGCANLPFQLPGSAKPATATALPEPSKVVATVKAESSPTPTSAPQPKNDPTKALTIFLDGQKSGTPYALISNLLSSSLSTKIKDDAGLKLILGSPESIGEFKIGSPSFSDSQQKSILDATVYMPKPANLRFAMVVENGEWKIDEIKVVSGTEDYPTTPEGVVLSFLTAYQEAPDRMSNFLTATRRSTQPPGGATAMLQINGGLEGMVIQSAAVNPDPPTASIKVLVRAGGKDYPRTFFLTKDDANWGIDGIEITTGN